MKNLKNTQWIFFGASLLILSWLTFILIKPYLMTIAMALITVVVFHGVYDFIYKRISKNKALATTLTVIVFLLFIIVPLGVVINMTANQTLTFYRNIQSEAEFGNVNLQQMIDLVNQAGERIPYLEFELTREKAVGTITNAVRPIGNYLLTHTPNLLSLSATVITQMIIYFTLLFAVFPNYKEILKKFKSLSPFPDKVDDMYLNRLKVLIKSLVKGTIVIAFIQSLIGVATLAIVGADYLMFWFVIMFVMGIIPAGVMFVTYPAGIIFLLLGQYWEGLFIIAITTLIINNVDNILRAKLTSGDSKMHPVLILIGVLAGLEVFGPFGFIFGPIILMLMITTLEVYEEYFKQ